MNRSEEALEKIAKRMWWISFWLFMIAFLMPNPWCRK